MINFQRLETRIKNDEGFSATVYQDVFGKWTIGYGSTYIHGKPVTQTTPRVTRRQAFVSLRAGIYYALMALQRTFPGVDGLDGVRGEVIVNMIYNLGESGLNGFTKMKRAVVSGDWDEAANQIEDSLYFNQVGTRAKRLRDAMRSGLWVT